MKYVKYLLVVVLLGMLLGVLNDDRAIICFSHLPPKEACSAYRTRGLPMGFLAWNYVGDESILNANMKFSEIPNNYEFQFEWQWFLLDLGIWSLLGFLVMFIRFIIDFSRHPKRN